MAWLLVVGGRHSSGQGRTTKRRRRRSLDSGQAHLSQFKELLGRLLQRPAQAEPEQQIAPSTSLLPALALVADDPTPYQTQGAADSREYASSRANDTLSIAASGESEVDEEGPCGGTQISTEAFGKAATVLCRALGFKDKGDVISTRGRHPS